MTRVLFRLADIDTSLPWHSLLREPQDTSKVDHVASTIVSLSLRHPIIEPAKNGG